MTSLPDDRAATSLARCCSSPSAAAAVRSATLALLAGLLVQQVRAGGEPESEPETSDVHSPTQAPRGHVGERGVTQGAADALLQSVQRDHDELVADAAKLWPAHPELLPRYEQWRRRAQELIDGRAADEAQGLARRPGLAELASTLAELRQKAKPLSEAQVVADRALHPRFAEFQAKQAELSWRSRMLGLEAWPSEAEEENALAREELPTDASSLNSLAWPLVNPRKPVYGQEVRALLLARRAAAAASAAERAVISDTLAWALFKVGRFEEALGEKKRLALSAQGGDGLGVSTASLERAFDAWRGGELAKRRKERDKLEAEVAALTSAVNERQTYVFEDLEQERSHQQLARIVSDLEALRSPETGLMSDVLAEPFGWGVAKRHEFAKTIRQRSVDGPDARRLWAQASAAIRNSPQYGGLELAPQLGLLPLGMDPRSQLWEFAHLQTGDPAVRGADGKLVLTEETGLVFVLLPGGKFWMGAQRLDPGGRNYDPLANDDESPVHEVELSPYFLSKYELTQGQWQRIAATNPSHYRPPGGFAPSLLHPVEKVNWSMGAELLALLGLSLPSEAQWECGARGGTTTAWWTGQERESLRGKVNLADRTAKNAGASWLAANDWPDLEDGCVAHCEVGTYPANAFGLHEVAGNVWEWCLDGYAPRSYSDESRVNPVSPFEAVAFRVGRGGAFDFAAKLSRSAHRGRVPRARLGADLGLRPARALSPAPTTPRAPK